MNLEKLGNELYRLGLAVRACGVHGYIFTPHCSGGINLEGGTLHFWDCGINLRVDPELAMRQLSELPDGAGYAKTISTLQNIAA